MARGGIRTGAGRKPGSTRAALAARKVEGLHEAAERLGIKRSRGRPAKEPTIRLSIPDSLLEGVRLFVAHKGLKLPFYTSGVQAGVPNLAEPEHKQVDLMRLLVKYPEDMFLVPAKGDSMKDAGILDGSILLASRRAEPKNGMIVTALLNNEATVKFLSIRNDRVFLTPANPDYQEIAVKKSDHFIIQGVILSNINIFHTE